MTDQELDFVLGTWDAPAAPPSLRARVAAGFAGVPRRKVFGVPLRWAAACALGAASIITAATAVPYRAVMGRGWSQLADGTYLRTTTLAQPPVSIFKFYLLGSGGSSGGSSHEGWRMRYAWDHSSRTYFGYEIRFVPLGDRQYRVETRPLSRTLDQISPWPIGDYRLVPTPPLPPARILHENEPFEVQLLASNDEGVYDVVELSSARFADDPALRPSNPSELPPTSMRLSGPKLYVNGGFVAEDQIVASGPTVWFYLPGQGRWLVSLSQGGNFLFRQAGFVSGNTIRFRSGDDEFRVDCDQPVTTGGVQPVFVLHQRDFRVNPKHPLANRPISGSAGPPLFHYFTPGS